MRCGHGPPEIGPRRLRRKAGTQSQCWLARRQTPNSRAKPRFDPPQPWSASPTAGFDGLAARVAVGASGIGHDRSSASGASGRGRPAAGRCGPLRNLLRVSPLLAGIPSLPANICPAAGGRVRRVARGCRAARAGVRRRGAGPPARARPRPRRCRRRKRPCAAERRPAHPQAKSRATCPRRSRSPASGRRAARDETVPGNNFNGSRGVGRLAARAVLLRQALFVSSSLDRLQKPGGNNG